MVDQSALGYWLSQAWRVLSRGLLYAVLILGAFVMIMPFLWMLSTSIMTIGEANSGRLLPRAARLTCPYVNLPRFQEGTVENMSVSPEVRPGAQELPTDSYYVLIQQAEGTGEFQFQLIDNSNDPVPIAPVGDPDGAFTDEWQPIPPGGGIYDTGRGMSITFAPPGSYEEAGRRSGAARTDYTNCCEYPTDVAQRNAAERAEREYSGRPISEDLSSCRTTGAKIGYFFEEFLGGNYYQAWVIANFREYMGNSVIITLVTLAGMLIVSTLAAYAFGRMEFPGRVFLFGLLLSTMMIPETVTMIPNFLTITGNNPLLPFINWYDSLPALTVPFMASFFNIFLLRQFFAQIPDELWDAARIDGAGHLRFLLQVVLPLSRAPIMTVIIFAFIGSWNALLWPLVATRAGSDWWPISVGLQNFVSEAGPETHLWMAGASISMMPVLLLYFMAQKQFIEGIATTGLKG
ncbi:MAG: carbohydrate ABC transporter permease [Anaerolineae bacterium]|jgi:ABC-type glycerol-3-phosphate transport system permease component